MKKTFRKKTFRKKTFRKKTLRKRRGGFTEKLNKVVRPAEPEPEPEQNRFSKWFRMGTKPKKPEIPDEYWTQVVFTEEEKDKIRKYIDDNPNRIVRSTEIRDNLFPDMRDELKDNAAWEIQVVLGRGYSGR